ncbi:type VI secretion protein [Burkholderia ubonensis]|uniref:Hcp family type VI secretion system effector n=1 Tax=Burkholderia ubonensis TaxID=101571 RepID=UPI0007536DE3|nr:Hcp family type VI secretion system effector [Burkholderia ubonensis]KVP81056.1 type VI secretion protein [Burkholderia ubonensis]
MPMPCYLKLEGETQGKIEGSCIQENHKGTILVQAIEHLIDMPKCPQTGQPTGPRTHHTMTITKEFDKSSPKLAQALTSGERMKSVVLEFYRTSIGGKQEHYYTVSLENAIVMSIRSWTPNCLASENKAFGHMEDVSYSYEKITWKHEIDSIEAEDSWLKPKA